MTAANPPVASNPGAAAAAIAAAARDNELAAALRSPYRAYLAAAVLSLVIGVLLLVPSAYMFEVYGRVINSRSEATLGWLLLAAVGIYVMLELLELVRVRILQAAGAQVQEKLGTRVFEATFSARLNGRPGLHGHAPADLKQVTDFVSSPAVTGLLDMPAALGVLALLYVMSPWLGAFATFMVAVMIGIAVLQERLSSAPYGEAQRSAYEAQLRAAETLRNAQVVASMAMGPALHKLWARSQATAMLNVGQASERAAATTTVMRAVTMLQGSLLLGMAVWLALNGDLLGGPAMAIVASILGGRALAPMSQIVGQWRPLGAVRVAYRRLVEVLRYTAAEVPGTELPAPEKHLLAEDVMAHVPGTGEVVLHNVRLGCNAGQMVAVIGPSGCGKSSLMRVLVGLWPSHGGKVRLDGADVYSWHKSQLGRYLGYLPQTVELFDGTVAENIARFDRIDDEALQRAIDDAGIGPLIDSLPEGLQTRVGDGGIQLSGGERQRLGLARAVYGDVRLLVLDEPNASLDDAGDRALEALITQVKSRGAIVIAVTHRPQLLAHADHILLMKAGSTLRFGPRDEVLAAMRPPAAGVPQVPQAPGANTGMAAAPRPRSAT